MITAQNSHFSSADSSLVILTNYSDTLSLRAKSATDENFLYCYFTNSNPENTGFYDLFVINNIDDTLFLKEAIMFTKTNIIAEISPYTHHNNSSSSITISYIYGGGNNNSSISAYFYNSENDTIYPTNINVISADSLIVDFNTTQNTHGIYSLILYNNTDSIIYVKNAINILNDSYSHISTVSPDTFHNYNTFPTITLHGSNTHFSQAENTIWLQEPYNFEVSQIDIINDSTINMRVAIPIACKIDTYIPSNIIGSLYNSVDSFLGFNFYVYFYGGLDGHNSNSSVSIYPNPVSEGKLNIVFTNKPTSISTVNIYNTNGKLVLRKDLLKSINNHIIDISNLTKGVYFYSIINRNEKSSGKFIVI